MACVAPEVCGVLVRSAETLLVTVDVVMVVAVADDPVETIGAVEPEVVVVGIPGKEPVSALVFRVDRAFLKVSSDAVAPDLVSSNRLVASNNRRRSTSHDEPSRPSPLLMVTDLSLRCCGQGPLGNPSQTGMAAYAMMIGNSTI